MLQTQRARRDAPGAARHGRILVASLDERKQILGSVRPPLRTPLSPSGALDHRGLWTPRRSAAAAAGSDGPLPSPQVPKTARPSLFSSPGRAADRAGSTGPRVCGCVGVCGSRMNSFSLSYPRSAETLESAEAGRAGGGACSRGGGSRGTPLRSIITDTPKRGRSGPQCVVNTKPSVWKSGCTGKRHGLVVRKD